jgi:hypothetical protein
MIRIILLNNNKIMVDVSKTTKIEKKQYAQKDRYTFTRPNHKKKKKV